MIGSNQNDLGFKTLKEKQEIRKKILKRLKTIKKDAYSGLSCIEYDAINVTIALIECAYKDNNRRINNE